MRLAFILLAALLGIAQEPQSTSSSVGQNAAPPAATKEATNPAAVPEKQSPPTQSAPPASPSSPATQAPQTTAPSTPVIRVTTRMVLVDVVVTDNRGTPILDLKPADFEVRENGKPQKVVAFSFRQPPPAATLAAYKPPVFSPGVYTNLRDFDGVAGPPTILLVDALNTQVKDQMYLRQQLVKYLQNVEPGRNIAIYTLGSRLRMVQDFTSDPDLLHAALKRLTTQSSMFNQEQQDFQDEFPGLDPDSADASAAQMAQTLQQFEAEQQAFQRDIQVRMTLEAMQELARNVAGYIGRKNLVWLSGSFPLTVFPDETSSNPFAVQREYGDDLRQTAALFSANQIAVYPVDARGLVASFMPDASQRGASLAGARGGQNAVRMMQRGSTNLNASHDTMNELAGQTGGHAFYNRNDIDHAIALSVAEGSTYYTVAYYPEDKNLDGKFRKIEVKVDRKGVQTHYRKGYFAVDPKPVDENVARHEFYSALVPEAPLSTAMPFIVRITPPAKDQKDVSIDFSVVPTAITFQPQGELQHAEIDFVTRAYDQKGKPVGTPKADSVSTQLKPATYSQIMKIGLRFHQAINLPPGKYVLKMGVRDDISNQIGTLVAKVEVPQQGS